MVEVRMRVMEYNVHPTTPLGVRLASIKFLQRVILVHSRGPSDPRLHNPNDPHLAFCPDNHPFLNPVALKAEGHKVTEQCLLTFWNNRSPDVITAMVQSFGIIAKLRQELVEFVYTAFVEWKPAHLLGDSLTAVRSIYKTMRIALVHLNRTQPQGRYRAQVDDAIRKLDTKLQEVLAHGDIKRLKPGLDSVDATGTTPKKHRPVDPTILANFDFSTLSNDILAEIVVESLKLVTEEHLDAAIQAWKSSRTADGPSTPVPVQDEIMEEVVVKSEPIDPLIMDMEEDLQLEAPRPILEMEPGNEEMGVTGFKLPRPRPMSVKQRLLLVDSCLQRVQKRGHDHAVQHKASPGRLSEQKGKPTPEMWTLLLVRMITRGATSSVGAIEEEEEEEDSNTNDDSNDGAVVSKPNKNTALEQEYRMRRMLFEYVMGDFISRYQIATLWLNEEWNNDRILLKKHPTARINYDYWVKEVLLAAADRSDKESFSTFVLDLPELSEGLFDLLRDLAADKARMPTAMVILRPLVELRVPVREEALSVLLELMTHPAADTRKGAIHTVRRWWPDIQPMATRIRAYTTRCLERLAIPSDEEMDEDTKNALGRYLPERVTVPADKNEVTQYLEGSLALSVKDPSFLEPLFRTFSTIDPTVQEAVQDLLVRPIQAIGPNNPKLLEYLKTYPEGSETLVLKILNVFTEGTRPAASIINLVKSLLADRGADARFLMFIISEMDKAEIIRHLPKLVGTLNGTPERRVLLRQMFTSIVEVTQHTNTNQVREGQTKLLAPKELMIQLHDMEQEVGLRKAKEAISICFNLPEIFRSEVLVSVMQHYLDAKALPMLFVWTVLQAVATYKHLTAWVSTNLLSRLITKKVWTNQQLWDGFILCAERTEPNSFDALLQLPKEQLRDLVEKRPAMKVKLREYLTKRAGKSKARNGVYWEVLGEDVATTA